MSIESPWARYRRTNVAEMRPYVPEEDLSGVSVSPEDTPAEGGMIARNPMNHADQWYVNAKYFNENFAEDRLDEASAPSSTAGNKDYFTANFAEDRLDETEAS